MLNCRRYLSELDDRSGTSDRAKGQFEAARRTTLFRQQSAAHALRAVMSWAL
jgi:hypothetical protein